MQPEFELTQPPSDGISSARFSTTGGHNLIVSSWDKTVRLYDAPANLMRVKFDVPNPALGAVFGAPGSAFSANLDGGVYAHDLGAGVTTRVGNHFEAVRSIEYDENHGLVLTGSWDKMVSLWDPRQRKVVSSHAHPEKVYAMSAAGSNLVVGTAGRHVWIWDLRHMGSVQQRRESSLKYQTRAIRCMHDGLGYVVTSIEGRVAVEWYDPSPDGQKNKFAFKCHRQKVDGKDFIYPINAVAVHPTYGTFATGGCDGFVNTWDGLAKKRIAQFRRYPAGVAALDYSSDGTIMVIASSYTFEEGEKDHPPEALFIRACQDMEVQPKSAAK